MKRRYPSRRPGLRLVLAAAACTLALAGAAHLKGWSALARTVRSPAALLGPLGSAASGKQPFEGKVVEKLSAGSYTYLQVERHDGSREWVVVLSSSLRSALGSSASTHSSAQSDTRPGTKVRVLPMAYAERFASKRLDRVFSGLHFAMLRPL